MNTNWSRSTCPVARSSPLNPWRSRSNRAWLYARPSRKVGNTSATAATRSRYGTRSSRPRLFGQITPTLPRFNSATGFSRKRAAETSTQACAGSSAPSATWTKGSSTIFPPLTSGIDALPERFDAEPLHRVDEQLLGRGAQREIGLDDVLDHVGDPVL